MSTPRTSKEEVHAVNWLNESIASHIAQLLRTLEDLLDVDLEIASYHFDHNFSQPNDWSDDSLDALEGDSCLVKQGNEDSGVDCLRNCSAYVLEQASLGPTIYTSALQSNDSDGRPAFTRAAAMGASSTLELLLQLSHLVETTPPKSNWSIQAGGGSGWGFQVACGDCVHLSSGGGGGGGFYLSTASQTFTFGGGGGGGMQIFLNGSTFSIGGGGGCGIDDTDPRAIMCGFQSDHPPAAGSANDASEKIQMCNLSQVIAKLHAQLSSCSSPITVVGGGGGGGGTGACCWPFRIGYGFSFELRSPDRPGNAATLFSSPSPLLRDRAGASTTSIDASHSQDRGEEGGVLGEIFAQASSQCVDPRDWCCRVLYAQHAVQSCVALRVSEASPTSAPQPELELLCKRVEDQHDAVAWLLRTPYPEDYCRTNASWRSPSSSLARSHSLAEGARPASPHLKDVGYPDRAGEEQDDGDTIFSLPSLFWQNDSLHASYPVRIHLPPNASQDDRSHLLSFACLLRDQVANASSQAAEQCPIQTETCWQCVSLIEDGSLVRDGRGDAAVSEPQMRIWQPRWTRRGEEEEETLRWMGMNVTCSVILVACLWLLGGALRRLVRARAVHRADCLHAVCGEVRTEGDSDCEERIVLPTESTARYGTLTLLAHRNASEVEGRVV